MRLRDPPSLCDFRVLGVCVFVCKTTRNSFVYRYRTFTQKSICACRKFFSVCFTLRHISIVATDRDATGRV